MDEAGVGMTAGYFSALKKVTCHYAEPTPAATRFVIKTWPDLEIMPAETIRRYFKRDIQGYAAFGPEEFYPHPDVVLAAFDEPRNRWALVMHDADDSATHKVHESELTFDETAALIPKLVDLAVRWEGCHAGPLAARLDAIGVDIWSSPANLDQYRAVMAEGAPFLDKMLANPSWMSPPWDACLGPNFVMEFTKRYDAVFALVDPANGATCTLSHGDFRGDNLFLAPPGPSCPHGWMVIDFQLMFRGPVPSDLAFLMNSGSVLPEVYSGEGRRRILRMFYDAFMARTRRYPTYTFDQFEREYLVMSTILFVYFIGMGAAYWHAGAFKNQLAARVELGNAGATEADLTKEERRQRMWWRKVHTNHRETFAACGLRDLVQSLPVNVPAPVFAELPPHLR